MRKKKHKADISKFSVNELRQRMFVKRSEVLYGSKYTYNDDVPDQIEKLEGFTNWGTFSEEWDIYWAGLDPTTLKWVAGRHNSPFRTIVFPLRIVLKDERTGRMLDTHTDKKDLHANPAPIKKPLPETEQDRIISESLSGKVVIDESDEDKAIRLIEKNMVMLQEQLDTLLKSKK